jgi:hypothetical protein
MCLSLIYFPDSANDDAPEKLHSSVAHLQKPQQHRLELYSKHARNVARVLDEFHKAPRSNRSLPARDFQTFSQAFSWVHLNDLNVYSNGAFS